MSWKNNEEDNSWRSNSWGSGDGWGDKSKSWTSSSWGSGGDSRGRDRNTESRGWYAKEEAKDNNHSDQKRHWDGDESAAKRQRADEVEKEEDKHDSTPRMPSTPVGAFAPQPARMPMTPVGAGQMPGVARMPMTPMMAAPGTVGRIPMTPMAGQMSAPGRIPMTPVGAGSMSAPGTGTRIPQTPMGAGAAPGTVGRIPMTPVGAGQMGPPGRIPMTPMGAGQTPGAVKIPMTPTTATPGRIPQTPAGAFIAAGTPAGPPPGTPGVLVPGTVPGTPAGPPPGTPAGFPMSAPGTPAVHSGGRMLVTPARAEAPPPEAMTPALAPAYAQFTEVQMPAEEPLQQQIVAYQPETTKVDVFGDGVGVYLRHAPRRQKGTGEKLPTPGTKATKPEHWKTTAAGKKDVKAKVAEEPVPAFDQWRKTRRKEGARIVGVRQPGQEPAPVVSEDFERATRFVGAKKGKVFKLGVHGLGYYMDVAAPKVPPKEEVVPSSVEAPSPLPAAADMTPGLVAGMETPRLPGVDAFALGAETPMGMRSGDMTPRIPDVVWTKEDATPHLGDSTPIPSRGGVRTKVELADQTPLPGAETPMLPIGGETPIPRMAAGADTPMLPPGAETPRLPPGAETPRLPPQSGEETPMPYDRGSMTPIQNMPPVSGAG